MPVSGSEAGRGRSVGLRPTRVGVGLGRRAGSVAAVGTQIKKSTSHRALRLCRSSGGGGGGARGPPAAGRVGGSAE
eukprot:5050624-Prymnesium_polylepis.1